MSGIDMVPNVLGFMKYGLPEDVEPLVLEGRHSEAERRLEDLIKSAEGDYRRRLEFELDRLRRWPLQYPYSEEDAYNIASRRIRGLSRDEFLELLSSGCVDHVKLDGRIRIFERFLPNMVWLCPTLKERYEEENGVRAKAKEALRERAREVMAGEARPLTFRVRAELRIRGDAVPKGERIRIWLPLPRRSALHPEVRVLSHSGEPYISSEDHPQRTAYFETTQSGDGAAAWVEYEVEVVPRAPNTEQESDLDGEPQPHHLAERIPHITFLEELRGTVRSLIEGIDDPLERARRVWDWVIDHTTYTYVHDYALFDNISWFAFQRRRGDCGVQAILLITMLRLAGIPARWQSGWYANPVRWGMHDWAQLYVEPMGWIYVDPSFGHPRDGEEWRRDFYFGGIEGYRLAFNSEISHPFDPPKEHFRSDPVDSQRGEAEWDGGNLYYDEMDAKLEILEVRRT